jgi:hypothetical protein
MAAPTLKQLREGLAANLTAGLPANTVQISGYMLPNPTPPCIHLYPDGDLEYDLAMRRGLDKWRFTVQAFVPFTNDAAPQILLDGFLNPSGSTSVKQALEQDSTLGGVVADVNVVSMSGYKVYVRDGGGPVLGAEWRVEIIATGN